MGFERAPPAGAFVPNPFELLDPRAELLPDLFDSRQAFFFLVANQGHDSNLALLLGARNGRASVPAVCRREGKRRANQRVRRTPMESVRL